MYQIGFKVLAWKVGQVLAGGLVIEVYHRRSAPTSILEVVGANWRGGVVMVANRSRRLTSKTFIA